jgi:hypothetical protein
MEFSSTKIVMNIAIVINSMALVIASLVMIRVIFLDLVGSMKSSLGMNATILKFLTLIVILFLMGIGLLDCFTLLISMNLRIYSKMSLLLFYLLMIFFIRFHSLVTLSVYRKYTSIRLISIKISPI